MERKIETQTNEIEMKLEIIKAARLIQGAMETPLIPWERQKEIALQNALIIVGRIGPSSCRTSVHGGR